MSPICPRAQRRPRTRPRPRRRSPVENRRHTEGLDRPWSPAGPRRSPRGAHGGTGCPNLPQRPGSRRKSGRESLIFCDSSLGRSHRVAPLWQIWTRLRSGSSQEPHASHRGHAPLRRISFGRRRRPATPTRRAHRVFLTGDGGVGPGIDVVGAVFPAGLGRDRVPGGVPPGRVGVFLGRLWRCCTLERGAPAGGFRVFRMIPGFFLEGRFLAGGLPCAGGSALHMGGFHRR